MWVVSPPWCPLYRLKSMYRLHQAISLFSLPNWEKKKNQKQSFNILITPLTTGWSRVQSEIRLGSDQLDFFKKILLFVQQIGKTPKTSEIISVRELASVSACISVFRIHVRVNEAMYPILQCVTLQILQVTEFVSLTVGYMYKQLLAYIMLIWSCSYWILCWTSFTS